MNNFFKLILVTSCLTGCMSLEDRGISTKESSKANQETSTCSFLDENGKMRRCIEKKYKQNTPKTYSTGVLTNGDPIAVLNETENTQIKVYQPIDKETQKEVSQPVIVTETTIQNTVISIPSEETATEETTVEETTQDSQKWWAVSVKEEITTDEETTLGYKELDCPCADPNTPCPECFDK